MKVTTDSCLFGAIAAESIQNSGPLSILDIGTGTGLLSLMLLQFSPLSNIDAVEIDPAAAEQAAENIESSPWSPRARIINENILHYKISKKYDLVISNPPFYENELRSPNKERNIAHHNSDLGLKEVFTLLKDSLSPTGKGWLLLPYKRRAELRPLLQQSALSMEKLFLVRPSTRHEFFRMIICVSHYRDMTETGIEEIAIMDDNNHYTPVFSRLLHPYYLRL